MSEAIKFDICCAARVLFRAGLSVANAGHISVTVASDRMLVNRFGPSFATLTPRDILTVNLAGKVLEYDPSVDPYVNDTIQLHGIIHRHNPKLVAVAHTHPPAVVTWSAFQCVPEVFDQESCILAGDIALVEDEYAGLAASEERVAPVARVLGDHPIAILPNHGAITTGPTVQLAMMRMLLLEGMCQRNISVGVAARATGLTPQAIKKEHAMTAKSEIAKIPYLQPFWKDLMIRLRQSDPDLFAGHAAAA
jgi:ribulose-5-phosphate 4-epimerase/fuculose-1-phosphate aldolase